MKPLLKPNRVAAPDLPGESSDSAEGHSAPHPPERPATLPRPVGVPVVAWLFIVMGSVGFVYHAPELLSSPRFAETLLVCLIRLVAIVAGIFLLRGRDWARWTILAWMAYHVALSLFHNLAELLMHALIFAALLIYLTRPTVTSFLRQSNAS